LRGLQCKKSLWLRTYQSDILKKPDDAAKAIFATDDKVGAWAYKLFSSDKRAPYEITTQVKNPINS